ncbi:MAG: ornithine cyclodeaminase family protein [Chloroflexi bacterium]|nr:ornithine cyclodeaminase family protein [Chloroflexota bacterium]
MTRLLTNDDIERLLTMDDCLSALEVAYREHARGITVGSSSRVETVVPTPTPDVSYEFTSIEGAVPAFGVMALRCNSNHMAMRIVNGMKRKDRLPDAPGGRYVGLILIFSLADLRLLGILQDGFISAMRVGATNALAARALARSDAGIVGLIGAGDQARKQLAGLAAVRPLREARVFSPNRERRESFANLMSQEIGLPIRPVDSAREAVRGADILAAATNSFDPVFEAEWIEPGMHVTAILSYEVPPAAYDRADVVVVNNPAGYGRGVAGHYDASADWARYPTLGQLLVGEAPGRADDRQVTFFMNNAGIGFQFAAVGARVLESANAASAGCELPDDLFLQSWHT